MKKKIVSLCMVAALAACAVGGATLAYFSDEDSQKNTMTLGEVEIVQNEKQRQYDDEGKPAGMGEFVQEQALFPMVDNRAEGDAVVVDGWYDADMANVIDKVVSVTNTGTVDAYVRTVFAFESGKVYKEGSDDEWVDAHDEYIGILGSNIEFEEPAIRITIGGTEYVIAVCTYSGKLAPGATSAPSLKQFFLAPTAGNEVMDLFGGTYDILCLSQAVQVEGFVDKNSDGTAADDALDAAFGEVNATNCAKWFADIA